jgi:hypothetical protein
VSLAIFRSKATSFINTKSSIVTIMPTSRNDMGLLTKMVFAGC